MKEPASLLTSYGSAHVLKCIYRVFWCIVEDKCYESRTMYKLFILTMRDVISTEENGVTRSK